MKKQRKKQPVKPRFPIWGWAVIILGGVALVGLVAFQLLNAGGGYPAEVSVAQAAQKREQGVFILDVREPDEWQQVHIPGATLIPLGQLAGRVSEVPKDREIVVVCRSGNRSAKGRDILRDAGFTRVTSMAGGVTQWQAQGLPVASGQ